MDPKAETDESQSRQAGWQINRTPPDSKTVLVRLDDDKRPICLAHLDGKQWRTLDSYFTLPVTGWMFVEDAAFYLDQVGNPP